MKQKLQIAVELGRRGGLASAKSLSPKERKARGRKAAEARWGKSSDAMNGVVHAE